MLTQVRSKKLLELLNKLDRFEGPAPLDELQRIVKRLKLSAEDVRPFLIFGEECYRRNLIQMTPHYQVLLLCWKPGQRSPIHDHNGSACCVNVIQGVATEVIFDRSASGLIFPSSSHRRNAGEVCGSFDSDMHQMGNLEAKGNLASLHIYSPPLLAMRTFHLGDAVHGEYVDRASGAKADRLLAVRQGLKEKAFRPARVAGKRLRHAAN